MKYSGYTCKITKEPSELLEHSDLMDYIEFIGKGETPDSFRDKINDLVKKEFMKIEKETVHPEVRDIIAKSKGPAKNVDALPKGLYAEYLRLSKNNKKRALSYDDDNDTLFLQEYKRKYPRINTSRYVPNESAELGSLGIVDSYLKHQEIVLSTLLPRTISNQWMINNDHIQQTSTIVEEMNKRQSKQISDLEVYREGLKCRYEPLFLQMRRQVKEKLKHPPPNI